MLSEREKDILCLVGLTNKQIARRLNLSWKTVEKVFANMYEKYGVKNRTKLLLEAIKSGELHVVDCGFWNCFGQYIEDRQIINMKKE